MFFRCSEPGRCLRLRRPQKPAQVLGKTFYFLFNGARRGGLAFSPLLPRQSLPPPPVAICPPEQLDDCSPQFVAVTSRVDDVAFQQNRDRKTESHAIDRMED